MLLPMSGMLLRIWSIAKREWGTISGELTGACQVENARTVLTALHILAKDFPAISAQEA